MALNPSMLLRNTPTRRTSSSEAPADSRSAWMFRSVRSVCAATSPAMRRPVAGSSPTCPLRYRTPGPRTAAESGSPDGRSSWIASRIALSSSLEIDRGGVSTAQQDTHPFAGPRLDLAGEEGGEGSGASGLDDHAEQLPEPSLGRADLVVGHQGDLGHRVSQDG